jgi:hypothetical protein
MSVGQNLILPFVRVYPWLVFVPCCISFVGFVTFCSALRSSRHASQVTRKASPSIEEIRAIGKIESSRAVTRGEWLSVVDEEWPAFIPSGQIAEATKAGQQGGMEG